jgi:hypothetical protein
MRCAFRTVVATVLLTGVWTGGSIAAEIRAGGTFEVKANSIWFTDAAMLARWQALAKGGDAQALSSYQEKVLGDRDAWQFTNPLTVKIVSHERDRRRVKVELTTPGRLQGTTWFLDDASLQQ